MRQRILVIRSGGIVDPEKGGPGKIDMVFAIPPLSRRKALVSNTGVPVLKAGGFGIHQWRDSRNRQLKRYCR